MTTDKQIEFCIADLPFHLLVAAWLYRRTFGIRVGSLVLPDDNPNLISLNKAAKAYENAIDNVLIVPQNSDLKVDVSQVQVTKSRYKMGSMKALAMSALFTMLQNYTKKQWARIGMLHDRGVYDVAVMPIKKEE